MLNSTAKVLLTATVGVILGWLMHSMASRNSDTSVHEVRKKVEQPLAHVQSGDAESGSGGAESAKSKQIALESLKLETEPNSEDADSGTNELVANVESVLDFLSQVEHEQNGYHTARVKVRELLEEYPELVYELLEALINIEDGKVKNQLSLALWTSKSQADGNLEPWLVERIELGDRGGDWLQVLENWGVSSRRGFDAVLGQLANNPDPAVISASIKVLNTTLSNYPLAMPPGQRQDINSQLRQFFDSNDDRVRQAAVESLSNFPQDDMAKIILNAFNDTSAKVRRGAVMSYMRKPVPSADIHSMVITQLQDDSRSYMERTSLARLAQTLALSEDERVLVQDYQKEAQEYFSSLSEEEQRALIEDVQ